ncbi:MAG: hypothetical protein EP334_02355 [Gammaproteobacteria bacterium]|nr:MAG: hypothetical protein EP334_02355 [Gammaproteobacteria bacterium]
MKSYVGHTIASASGDQLMAALGTFKYQLIPGIKTVEAVAPDVHQKHLRFPLQDLDVKARGMELAFINSKGFGGNNATAVVVAPQKVEAMLARRHAGEMDAYRSRREQTRQVAADYAARADRGQLDVIYRFGESLIEEESIKITTQGMKVPGYEHEVVFDQTNPWQDMA